MSFVSDGNSRLEKRKKKKKCLPKWGARQRKSTRAGKQP